jgi:hypothetical protein
MSTFRGFIVALGLAGLLTAPAAAQQPQRGGRAAGSGNRGVAGLPETRASRGS